jgi:hypothetical protein
MKARTAAALGLLIFIALSMASAPVQAPATPPASPFPPPTAAAPAPPGAPTPPGPPEKRKLFKGRLRERIKQLFQFSFSP